MDWASVWKVVLAIIGSIGGAGVIICAVVKFCSDRIAERLKANYQLEIDKKLEGYKADVEQRNHIRQSSFDKEMQAYQELCEKYNDLVESVYMLFPAGLTLSARFENDDELLNDCNERLHNAGEKYRSANITLTTKAAFIPKSLYVKFDEIRKSANAQIFDYHNLNPWVMKNDPTPEDSKMRHECFKRTSDLIAKWDALIDELREYLRSLSEQKES